MTPLIFGIHKNSIRAYAQYIKDELLEDKHTTDKKIDSDDREKTDVTEAEFIIEEKDKQSFKKIIDKTLLEYHDILYRISESSSSLREQIPQEEIVKFAKESCLLTFTDQLLDKLNSEELQDTTHFSLDITEKERYGAVLSQAIVEYIVGSKLQHKEESPQETEEVLTAIIMHTPKISSPFRLKDVDLLDDNELSEHISSLASGLSPKEEDPQKILTGAQNFFNVLLRKNTMKFLLEKATKDLRIISSIPEDAKEKNIFRNTF